MTTLTLNQLSASARRRLGLPDHLDCLPPPRPDSESSADDVDPVSLRVLEICPRAKHDRVKDHSDPSQKRRKVHQASGLYRHP